MRRVDAADFGSAGALLFDAPMEAEPFAESKVPPDAAERAVAGIIWRHQGRGNPIAIETLQRATGKGERAIKGIVEQLVVTHRMKIGAARSGEKVGYFVVVDAEDLEVAVKAYREQIFSMWRRLRVLLAPRVLRELHGQLVIGSEEHGEG